MLPRVGDERTRCAGLGAAACAGEEDLAHGVEAAYTRGRDASRREVRLDREPRDERDAVAREHRASCRLLEPELEPHVEIAESCPGLAELVLDHLPHAGAFLPHARR